MISTIIYILGIVCAVWCVEVGGQAVLGRQSWSATPWLTERHGYDPTYITF